VLPLLLAAALLPGWAPVSTGPAGGAVYQGRIPDTLVRWDTRASAVYLPPGFDPARRYPVVYLLHGMRGSPSGFWDGLKLATVADTMIVSGRAQPFIAVMPYGGPAAHRSSGEWAGVWEDYVVDDVVPWVQKHLPALHGRRYRALEGLSAGGFGAIDIGLRHPRLFGTLGSWGGYFAPVFRDGPFRDAGRAALAAHDPMLLVRREAASLRRSGTRFYLSSGGDHAGVLGSWTTSFAAELGALRLRHELWLAAGTRDFWQATLPSALRYATAAFAATGASA